MYKPKLISEVSIKTKNVVDAIKYQKSSKVFDQLILDKFQYAFRDELKVRLEKSTDIKFDCAESALEFFNFSCVPQVLQKNPDIVNNWLVKSDRCNFLFTSLLAPTLENCSEKINYPPVFVEFKLYW